MKWTKVTVVSTLLMMTLMLFIAVSWVACAPTTPRSEGERPLKRVEERIMDVAGEYGIYRFHDPRFDVTCWVYVDYRAGGISCLPDDVIKR